MRGSEYPSKKAGQKGSKVRREKGGRKLVRGSEYPRKITRKARSKSKKRDRGRK